MATVSCEVYWLKGFAEQVTIINSGHGHKIAVFESPSYDLSVFYLTEESYKQILVEADRRPEDAL